MQDILLDDTKDLQVVGGDFVIGVSDEQHQQCLLLAAPGAYKQFPEAGVGLMDYLNDDSPADMLREMRLQFAADGMTVNNLAYTNGQLQINAPYGG